MDLTHRLMLGSLFVVATIVYLPMADAPFVYEDVNGAMAGTPTLAETFSRVPGRGVTTLAAAVTHDDARLAHMANVALHLIAGAFVAGIAFSVAGPTAMCAAALAHLLNPLNSQAVTYVTGRSDLLMTIGVLLAVWSALQRSRWRFVGVVAGLLLAATSKEIGIVGVPLVVLTLLIWRPDQAKGMSPSVLWVLVGAVLGRAWALVFGWIQMVPGYGGADVPWTEFVMRQVGLTWTLLLKWAIPQGFSIDHDALRLGLGVLIAGVLATMAVVAVTALAWHRQPVLAWSLAFTGIALLPRLVVPTNEFIAERHIYLAVVGVSVGFGWVVSRWYAAVGSSEAARVGRQGIAQSRALSHT